MNYFEHHIGDYAQATYHLSFVEDAAYSRMIRKYYAEERPLPSDIKAVQRLVGARTKVERQAVSDMLDEFFHLESDGWHNKRCDAEIARYRDGEEEREEAKSNEKERQRRHREERKELFTRLRDARIIPKWDTPTTKLRELLSEATVTPPVTPPVTTPVTVTGMCMTPPVTPPVTPPNTATHTPVANTHTPVVNQLPHSVSLTQPASLDPPASSTRKGMVCGLLRKIGMSDAAPHYLTDQVWDSILSKRTDEEIVELAKAKMAARPGQRTGLKYLAPALLEDPTPIAINGQMQPRMTQHQRNQQAIASSLFGPQFRGPTEKLIQGEVVDER